MYAFKTSISWSTSAILDGKQMTTFKTFAATLLHLTPGWLRPSANNTVVKSSLVTSTNKFTMFTQHRVKQCRSHRLHDHIPFNPLTSYQPQSAPHYKRHTERNERSRAALPGQCLARHAPFSASGPAASAPLHWGCMPWVLIKPKLCQSQEVNSTPPPFSHGHTRMHILGSQEGRRTSET